jgi:lipopolysaccharide biosynthesis glycosyltransferase
MLEKITIVVGFDHRESIAYHTFCHSILEKSSTPVQFIPLVQSSLKNYTEEHNDGSNSFIYSRFLTPYLCNFSGWAIYADGDMVCEADITELFNLRDESKAVQVVKHSYTTKKNTKYLGNINENYPRKNWSSLILWNCSHLSNKILTPDFVSKSNGAYLHRFSWLDDNLIGELPIEWNWLAIEYPHNTKSKIIHYTLGTPCFRDYKFTEMAEYWHATFKRMNQVLDTMK